MKCTKNDGTPRLCPYRVFKEEHKAMLKGSGDVWSETFYNCMKTLCVAYNKSSDECMRVKAGEQEREIKKL